MNAFLNNNEQNEHISFSWDEMGCFLRPQYLLIENKRPGYGLLAYFLTAIYKVFTIGGYFSSENTAFFNFSKTILIQ